MASPSAPYSTAFVTSPGGREANEDACAVREAGERLCAIVADGLGGHLGGAVASQLAVEAALTAFEAGEPVSEIIAAANRAVLDRQQAEPDLRHMRTTLVVFLAGGGLGWWGHAGDSRLYWFRAGRVRAHTADHSVPQRLADAGEIAPEQIRFHEDRSCLLRSLGAKPDPGATVLSEPALLEPGDAFLLCSDGFWEWVTEEDMEAGLAAATTPKQWLATMVAFLQSRAEAGHDNYSAVAVMLGGNSGASTAPETTV